MTTINTNETVAVAANVATAVRVTLKSALESNDVAAVAAVLAKMGDKDAVVKMGLTFSLAVKEAKDILKEQAKAAELSAQQAVERREAKKAARLDAIAVNEAAIAEERQNMVTFLMDTVNGLGLDLDAAEVAAQAAIDKKHGVEKTKKYTFNRVAVVVDGKEYQMPTSGNMVQALKDAMTAGGYTTHKDFIIAHAVNAEEAAAAFA